MKKTIPFDLAKARAGAKVVTNTGQEVTILTYEGRDNERPIIGTFMHADYEPGKGIGTAEEILDRWPVNGVNIHPGGYDLLIEEEETPKGWYIKGEALMKDGNTIGVFFLSHGNDNVDKPEFLKRIAAALNYYEDPTKFGLDYGTQPDKDVTKISEVEYEEDPVVTMSREDWVKIRERLELLETENKILGDESHKKSLEIEELKAWKQKAIDSRKKFYAAVKYWESIRPE